jgi:uncharacterized protein (TIGR02145 family)
MNTPFFRRTTRLMMTCIAFAAIAFIVSCRKDDDVVDTPDNNSPAPGSLVGNSRTVDVIGQVFDESGAPLMGATVRAGYGSQSVLTDERGFFRLLDIAGYENIALVKVSKAGYFDGSRSFVPTDGQNRVRIALLAKNDAGSFSAAAGGQVSLEGVTIDFAPGSIALNGQPYSGTVHVAINSMDPSDTWNMSQQMPGSLVGANGDRFDVLRSLGMAGVELTDDSGQELQLQAGSTATVRFEVPNSLLADAPATIPLWHYSESQGYWVREGEATLDGTAYEGEVSHFSFWNCDIPAEAHLFTLTLLDDAHAGSVNPIEGAHVVITSTVFGPRDGYTDSNGVVSGLVPANEELVVNVFITCLNTETLVYTDAVGPLTADYSITWSITDLPNVALLQGQLINASGNPLDGYVYLESGGYTSTTNGSYELLACTGSDAVSGWYYEGNEICFSDPQSIELLAGENVADITVLECAAFGQPGAGGIDQEGDAFTSVIIGTQEWMSENLSVASYSDGTPIPQVTDPNVWASLTTGAWCWYDNDSATYAAIYGRLYNWYAVAGIYNVASLVDPSLRKQLAPSGWHVSADTEWSTMINFLDPNADGGIITPNIAGGKMKTTGTFEDGSGLWFAPNEMASNLSGFAGRPGGYRGSDANFNEGVFLLMGSLSQWWSYEDWDSYNGWIHGIYHHNGNAAVSLKGKKTGNYVRCLRN